MSEDRTPSAEGAAAEKSEAKSAGPELRRTQTIAGAALLLTVLAAVSAPRNPEPSDFVDLGDRFFPGFEDPEEARSLEVIEFDEATAEAIPFRVQNENGIWTIPSHHDYPADGKDRLAQTAAGIMLLEKDDFRSENVSDHPALGVVDPLDEGAVSLVGRGRRVTVKGSGDRVLADLIIGRQVEDREGAYFVRVPGQKRVYVSQLGVDISAEFADWIERDLLLMDRNRVEAAVLEDYTINERTLQVDRRARLELSRVDGEWTAEGLGSDEEVDSFEMNELLRAADELEIVGVRPKPAGIAATLTGETAGVSNADILSLQSRGYYLTQGGNLLSNEGEVRIETDEGIRYTLRFGEVLYGRGGSGERGRRNAGGRDLDGSRREPLSLRDRGVHSLPLSRAAATPESGLPGQALRRTHRRRPREPRPRPRLRPLGGGCPAGPGTRGDAHPPFRRLVLCDLPREFREHPQDPRRPDPRRVLNPGPRPNPFRRRSVRRPSRGCHSERAAVMKRGFRESSPSIKASISPRSSRNSSRDTSV